MIPKRYRGISSKDVRVTFRFGRREVLSGGFVRWRTTTEKNTRFAVIIPVKKVSKATQRSRIRRAVQSSILSTMTQLSFPIHAVIVWTSIDLPDKTVLEKELGRMFSRLK